MTPLAVAAVLTILAGAVSLVVWRRRSPADRTPEPAGGPVPAAGAGAGATVHPGPDVEVAIRVDMDSSRHCHPSSAIGPTPVEVPTPGYHLYLRIVSREPQLSVRIALTAEALRELPLGQAEVTLHAHRIEHVQPDFEILLDGDPPLVRPTLGPDGAALHPDVTLPLVVAPGETRVLLLVPLTRSKSLLEWQLNVSAATTERQQTIPIPQRITGDHGWVTFRPGGSAPEPGPSPMSNHWRPYAPY
ncbi:hypothetical protein ACIBJE_22695 [Micromonospora sp. NPDC050187]|uniref:hypothetical protein n=1 Tax=Micromonospora sp. NPDC050187 TaxID=3364277 RepID=UPI0037AAAF33